MAMQDSFIAKRSAKICYIEFESKGIHVIIVMKYVEACLQ